MMALIFSYHIFILLLCHYKYFNLFIPGTSATNPPSSLSGNGLSAVKITNEPQYLPASRLMLQNNQTVAIPPSISPSNHSVDLVDGTDIGTKFSSPIGDAPFYFSSPELQQILRHNGEIVISSVDGSVLNVPSASQTGRSAEEMWFRVSLSQSPMRILPKIEEPSVRSVPTVFPTFPACSDPVASPQVTLTDEESNRNRMLPAKKRKFITDGGCVENDDKTRIKMNEPATDGINLSSLGLPGNLPIISRKSSIGHYNDVIKCPSVEQNVFVVEGMSVSRNSFTNSNLSQISGNGLSTRLFSEVDVTEHVRRTASSSNSKYHLCTK